MQANLIYVFREIARALPGAKFYDGAELFWTLTPIRFAVFNSLFGARLGTADAGAAIAAAQQRAEANGVPLMWWVFPDDTPGDLPEALIANGFRRREFAPGMWLDLAAFSDTAIRKNGDVSIEIVGSEPAARAWCDVLSAGSGLPPAFGEGYFPFAATLARNPTGPQRNYALLVDGEMVATASVALHDGAAGIYNVATLEHARRKGFGAALTAHALRDARALGASIAVLQSSEAGVSLYRRLGFLECCIVQTFTWRG